MSSVADESQPMSAARGDALVEAYTQVEASVLDRRYASLRLPNPESVRALTGSIRRHGILRPLIVTRHDDDTLVLLDGFKRLSAVGEAPGVMVPVQIMRLSPVQAKAAMVTFNRPHSGLCTLEEAWIVRELVRTHELQQKAVAEILGCHKSWVCRRLQLAEGLHESVIDDMRLGLISSTVGRELVKLPCGNLQVRAAKAVQSHGLTCRQTGELVGYLLAAPDEESQTALLAAPLHYLVSSSSGSPSTPDARPIRSGPKLVHSLRALGRQSTRTAGEICSLSAPLSSSDCKFLRPTLHQTLRVVENVLDMLRTLDDNARKQKQKTQEEVAPHGP